MCDRCNKWRKLPPGAPVPGCDEQWFCAQNLDKDHSSCAIPQEGGNWEATEASGAADLKQVKKEKVRKEKDLESMQKKEEVARQIEKQRTQLADEERRKQAEQEVLEAQA